MVKVVVEITIQEMIGESLIAEEIQKALGITMGNMKDHPAIEKIEIKTEP